MLLVGPNIFIGYSTCLVFDHQWGPPIQTKIEVLSLATEYTIKLDKLQFLIGLPVD
jgi:hypothetical protein